MRLTIGARAACTAAMAAAWLTGAAAQSYRDRLPQDEVTYFLLPDRFDNADPANDTRRADRRPAGPPASTRPTRAFYHGGDLKGVIQRRMGRILKQLGVDCDLGRAESSVNKAVQGAPGHESPRAIMAIGSPTSTRMSTRISAATRTSRRWSTPRTRAGMKVYMDIVVNHTADVIQLSSECPKCEWGRLPLSQPSPTIRFSAAAVRQRRKPINPGFKG